VDFLMKRAPNPVDQHVGSRVRMRRVLLGMSQEKLAESLGLTFQQVQKYEKGTNRIGASRLQEISNTLQVAPSFFFEGLNGHAPAHDSGFAEEASARSITNFVITAEGLQLNKAFTQITDPKVRRRIIDLVIAVAGSQAMPSADDS
jgi:transcriptional regulator with XRE-family HTH domain